MVEAGCESLRWLLAEQHRGDDDIFVPIGSMGFFVEGGEKARFDQQPVEACATIAACLAGLSRHREQVWLKRHGPPFAGSSARTTSKSRCMTLQPAVAETGCIPTASTRTRAPNRRFPS